MKNMTAILLGTIFTILLTTSCTQKPQEQILGEWEDPKNIVYEFFENGKLTITRSGYGSAASSWAMSKDGKVIITYPDERKFSVTPKFLENGTLELDFEGKVLSLTRLDSTREDSGSTKLIGKFGGKGCIYDALDFRSGGKVYIIAFGSEIPGTYELDGNKVIVMSNGESAVFTRSGDVLDAGIAGKCSRL
ncbi:MAG: hypothetical protein ACC657_17795 [Thiohalomonadales bacterium]